MITTILIIIAIGVSILRSDRVHFHARRLKYRKNKLNEVQEKRLDWLNVLLSSIRTHEQLCYFHETMHDRIAGNDYFHPKFKVLKKNIERKELALKRLRIKEGDSIFKSVKL